MPKVAPFSILSLPPARDVPALANYGHHKPEMNRATDG